MQTSQSTKFSQETKEFDIESKADESTKSEQTHSNTQEKMPSPIMPSLVDDNMSFSLPDNLLEGYKSMNPLNGFSGLSEFTYYRTYSRILGDGKKEVWFDTVRRVVEGCYSMQKDWTTSKGLPWDEDKALGSALIMFDLIFTLKFTPPGRGLWTMGTSMTTKRGIYMSLNNCAFISTKDIDTKFAHPFTFLMDVSMLGVGCGFDVRGAGKVKINEVKLVKSDELELRHNNDKIKNLNKHLCQLITEKVAELQVMYDEYEPPKPGGFDSKMSHINSIKSTVELFQNKIKANLKYLGHKINYHEVGDSREGWVAALGFLVDNYLRDSNYPVIFDFSKIREKGTLLKGFGGLASGPEPLIDLFITIENIFNGHAGKQISVTDIADVMNLIGKCVVAGNVRRSSEICIGEADDQEFIDLKNYEKNPHRASYGWNSNNSVLANENTDYSKFLPTIVQNGEPGFLWLDNVQKYSRMNGVVDNRDADAIGTNPCAEQSLHDGEVCNLVEVYLNNHMTYASFAKSLKYAFLYAKTVSCGPLHWEGTDAVVTKNRRIGTSVSGIADFLARHIDEESARLKKLNPFISEDELHKKSKDQGLELGLEKLQTWCNDGFNLLKKYDKTYSQWLDINESIKITSVKPSGCLVGDTEVLVRDASGNFKPTKLSKIVHNRLASSGVDISSVQPKTFIPAMFFIKDMNGNANQVDNIYINGKEKVYKIPLGDNNYIKCTGSHRFLVKYDPSCGVEEWKCAKDLCEGDEILCHQRG